MKSNICISGLTEKMGTKKTSGNEGLRGKPFFYNACLELLL